LGVAYAEQGKLSEAERAFSDVLTILDKRPKPDTPTQAAVYTNLASLYLRKGMHKKARKMAAKAKALRDQETSPS
jgi:Flp pilus assembly protein TadD